MTIIVGKIQKKHCSSVKEGAVALLLTEQVRILPVTINIMNIYPSKYNTNPQDQNQIIAEKDFIKFYWILPMVIVLALLNLASLIKANIANESKFIPIIKDKIHSISSHLYVIDVTEYAQGNHTSTIF